MDGQSLLEHRKRLKGYNKDTRAGKIEEEWIRVKERK